MSEEKQPFNPNRGILSSRRGGKAARFVNLHKSKVSFRIEKKIKKLQTGWN